METIKLILGILLIILVILAILFAIIGAGLIFTFATEEIKEMRRKRRARNRICKRGIK